MIEWLAVLRVRTNMAIIDLSISLFTSHALILEPTSQKLFCMFLICWTGTLTSATH
jgi:hypothetical protein